MEQILILILFVIGSIISSIIQNKKKRQEHARELNEPAGPLPPKPPRRPFEQWPQTTADWQEELRRLLQQGETPPPIIQAPPPRSPVPIVTSPLSAKKELVGLEPKRQKPVSHSTVKRRPAPIAAPPVNPWLRWTRTPNGLREAFVASLVFSPPVALSPEHRPGF